MPNPFRPISNLICFMLVLVVFACNHATKKPDKKTVKKMQKVKLKEYKEVNYTESQLIAFLDSVGRLPVQPLADTAAFYADSIFKTFTEPMHRELSAADFSLLKSCIHVGMIKAQDAKNIFGELKIDSACTAKGLLDSVKKGNVYLEYFSFDTNKNRFDEFGILIGDAGHCPGSKLYFFKGKKIIAKQSGYSRYTDNVEHFKDADGGSIVYRRFEFAEGSGIWWRNYFFYKYDGDNLIPILNYPETCNAEAFWRFYVSKFEAKIQKTNPLTMKVVFRRQFYNDDNDVYFNYGPVFINDSISIRYDWDNNSKALSARYQQTKLNKAQILSYYLTDNDYLFINSHYKLLKTVLADKKQRPWLLDYLNKVKNYYNH
ncbi:hypothetical protein ABID99_000274 [Mucilaginibacter sp. OAE612]